MYSKCWQIIKDDSRMTFEICGQTDNSNWFTNTTSGMQKAGMNVSCMTPQVTNKISSKEAIKIFGYSQESGLHERLLKEYKEIVMKSSGEW